MIIKIGASGSDPGGMIRYFADTQSQYRGQAFNVHTDPRIVTGSLGYIGPLDQETVVTAVADLRTPSLMFPEKTLKHNHIWHAALVLKPGEGPIDDEIWKNVSKDFMREMHLDVKGPSRTRWIAVNHGLNNSGADHVHIAANLICENGHRADDFRSYQRSQEVAKLLEDKYGLEALQSRRTGLSGRPFNKNDHTLAVEQGRSEPRRVELERRVRAAAVGVLDEKQFIENLAADGIGYKPRKDVQGNSTGYAVNLPETTTSKGIEHWWAGGKIARDLSLPRLQQYWKNNSQDTPKHMQAVDELLQMQRALPSASVELLADSSHQLAGALAVVSQKTEDPPGPLAQASHEAGKLAQTRIYTQRAKPGALAVALLFLAATDPGGPVGKAVMIKQLMATYRALLDAHAARRYVVNPERTAVSMAGAEDEMLEMAVTTAITTGAIMLEHHAHKKAADPKPKKQPLEPWDRNTIRGFREQDRWDQMRARVEARELEPRITQEQSEKIAALAERFGTPAMAQGSELYTQQEAAKFITSLEQNAVGLPVPEPVTHAQEMAKTDAFMDSLEAKHGDKVPAPVQELANPAQLKWLHTKGGLSEAETKSLSKADASRIIAGHSDAAIKNRQTATQVHLTPSKNIHAAKAPPKYTRGR